MEPPPFVVRITGKTRQGEPFPGTGFVVTLQGHVATCYHVIEHAELIQVQLPYPHNKPARYEVCKKIPDADIALLQSIVPLTVSTPCATLHTGWRRDTQIGD